MVGNQAVETRTSEVATNVTTQQIQKAYPNAQMVLRQQAPGEEVNYIPVQQKDADDQIERKIKEDPADRLGIHHEGGYDTRRLAARAGGPSLR